MCVVSLMPFTFLVFKIKIAGLTKWGYGNLYAVENLYAIQNIKIQNVSRAVRVLN